MIKLDFGGRTFRYDEKRPLSAGDLVVIREMGADPEKWVAMVDWIGADGKAQLSDGQYAQIAEALIQIAYLAAVREDHSLTWREFIWDLPLDNTASWTADVVPDEPANRAERRVQAKAAPKKRAPKAASTA